MSMYEKFEALLESNNVTPYRVHKETGISTATLSDWKNGKSEPKRDKIQKICTYFNVPMSYFYEKEKDTSKEVQITARDKKDITKDLNNIMEKLTSGEAGPASYDGEELGPEAAELFKEELEIALKRLKIINKEKYTPKKYKK